MNKILHEAINIFQKESIKISATPENSVNFENEKDIPKIKIDATEGIQIENELEPQLSKEDEL
jgi:hypothetical protein